MSTEAKKVYAAISAVSAALSMTGIGKDRKVDAPGAKYNFRGIDDVFNALSAELVAAKLVIIPRVVDRHVTERETTKETREGTKTSIATHVILTMDFDFVSVEDGSTVTARMVGEALDTSDKSANKAMSAAYKYAAFQVFCIPVEGLAVDGETDRHEPRGNVRPMQPASEPRSRTESDKIEATIAKLLEESSNIEQLAAAGKQAHVAKQKKEISDAAVKRLQAKYGVAQRRLVEQEANGAA
jgi:hypothetical protein